VRTSVERGKGSCLEQICSILDKDQSIKGLPLFRLGILHILEDADEQQGLKLLEQAYEQDQREVERDCIPAEKRGAYLLLAVVKDFFDYLRTKKPHEWESGLLANQTGKTLISCPFHRIRPNQHHPLDMKGFTTTDFLNLIKSDPCEDLQVRTTSVQKTCW